MANTERRNLEGMDSLCSLPTPPSISFIQIPLSVAPPTLSKSLPQDREALKLLQCTSYFQGSPIKDRANESLLSCHPSYRVEGGHIPSLLIANLKLGIHIIHDRWQSLFTIIRVNKPTFLNWTGTLTIRKTIISVGILHFTFQSVANKLLGHAEFSQQSLTVLWN